MFLLKIEGDAGPMEERNRGRRFLSAQSLELFEKGDEKRQKLLLAVSVTPLEFLP
ncbi:MAG: hypothetical protein WC525_05055 [Candidatus Thermoplasmatota archaeon]